MKRKLLTQVCSFIILTCNAFAQDKATKISLATVKTELEQSAISIGLNYVKSLDSLFKVQDILVANKNSLWQLTPQFSVQTGNEDAFSSITAKLTGIGMFFKDTTIDGIITPNTSRGFQTYPFSVGAETNNTFSIINAIAEVGWVPWYQTTGNQRTKKWMKHTKIGMFIQGGYKFNVDTSANTAGGGADESKEELNDILFRAKGSFAIDTRSLFEISGVGVGVVGNADGWYDFINNEVYYTLKGNLRFYLTAAKDKYFDFAYQKGSGAPNFNEGDQFGIGLTVTF